MILQGFDARKQKTKAKKNFQLCQLFLGKKTPGQSLCRLQWEAVGKEVKPLPTATPKAVGKEHFKKNIFFLCRLPSWRPVGKQFLKKKFFADCRGTSSRQSLPSGLTAPRGYADCWRGSWQRLCRLCATWQSANPPLPTQALLTSLCRLPRGFAVGKAFADWVYAFADWGKQSAKRCFPVVTAPPNLS